MTFELFEKVCNDEFSKLLPVAGMRIDTRANPCRCCMSFTLAFGGPYGCEKVIGKVYEMRALFVEQNIRLDIRSAASFFRKLYEREN